MFLCIFVAEVNVSKAGIPSIYDALQIADYIRTVEEVSTVDKIRALR